MRDIKRAEVDKMVQKRVAIPAPATEWAAPVVLAPQKDGTLRFCVDYRSLNAMNVPDAYPIPRMDRCIYSLGDVVIFSTLDGNSQYWQMPIALKDMKKCNAHHTLWHLRAHAYVFWTRKCTSDVPESDRNNTNHSQVTVSPRVLGRHHRLLFVLRTA